MGSQGGPSTSAHTSFEEIGSSSKRHQVVPQHTSKNSSNQSRHTYLPTVLGFSADDLGTDDWKEMRAGMKAKERAMPPKAFNEEYIKRRSVLVDWMSQTSETVLRLVPITIHIAVAFLDAAVAKLGDQYIKPTRLQLMATACILTAGTCRQPKPSILLFLSCVNRILCAPPAAKMEENDGQVPSVYELNRCCQDGYSPQLIVKMESLLLDLLDWNLVVLTPRHFLELYEGGGALVVQPFEEFVNNTTIPPLKMASVQRYQREYAEFFVDLCLHGTPASSVHLCSSALRLTCVPPWLVLQTSILFTIARRLWRPRLLPRPGACSR